jgi:hypothetical protein
MKTGDRLISRPMMWRRPPGISGLACLDMN